MALLCNNIKLTTTILAVFFIIVLTWQIYVTKTAGEKELIIKMIEKSALEINFSIKDLEYKVQNILEQKPKPRMSEEKIQHYERQISFLPYWDFTQLSNMDNFRFYTFNNVCEDNFVALIFVNSKPDHYEKRNVIRNSWGNKNITQIRVLFSLGAVNVEEQTKIEEENNLHKDILQGNFIDSYNNLTYKNIMNLKYVTYYCPKIEFIVKMDDDSFVHTPNLVMYLQNGRINPQDDELFCAFIDNLGVFREHEKWAVPYEDHPNKVYPRYCFGNYPTVYRYNVAYNLYKECQRGDFFFIEDVYITGIVAKRLNYNHVQAFNYTLNEEETRSLLNNEDKVIRNDFLYAFTSLTSEDITKLWSIYKDSNYTQ